jgi:hypothetical protein
MPPRNDDLFQRLRRAGIRKPVAKALSELTEDAGKKAIAAGHRAVAELRALADELEKRLPPAVLAPGAGAAPSASPAAPSAATLQATTPPTRKATATSTPRARKATATPTARTRKATATPTARTDKATAPSTSRTGKAAAAPASALTGSAPAPREDPRRPGQWPPDRLGDQPADGHRHSHGQCRADPPQQGGRDHQGNPRVRASELSWQDRR